MQNKLMKLKDWLANSFQFITVGLLVICLFVLINQQRAINNLRSDISSLESDISNLEDECDVSEVKNSLDNVENNLEEKIEEVRRTVIIWGN